MIPVSTGEYAIIRVPPLWSAPVDPAAVARAAAAWRAAARAADTAADDLGPLPAAFSPWHGDDADACRRRIDRRRADLADAAALATRTAASLDRLADRAAATAHALDQAFSRLSREVAHHVGTDAVTFAVNRTADARLVRQAVRAAARLRADLDHGLAGCRDELAATVPAWQDLSGDAGQRITRPQPDLVVVRDDGLVLVSTGSAADRVLVRADTAGHTQVLVDGSVVVPDLAGAQLVLRTGDGADSVTIDAAVHAPVTVLGGTGDDVLTGGSGDDRLYGSDGLDTVLGGAGDDTLLGGDGRDYLDGGRGDDTLAGGAGDDTAYGLGGDDTLTGGPGRDYLSGGQGRDRLSGDPGDDVLVGGAEPGAEDGGTADGGSGLDRGYHLHGHGTAVEITHDITGPDSLGPDSAGRTVRVEGSPEFIARVGADLDLLRASPAGLRMLTELDRGATGTGPDSVTIRELGQGSDNGYADMEAGTDRQVIWYEPTFDTLTGSLPPAVVLFHELAHVWDRQRGYRFPGSHTGTDLIWQDGQWLPAPNPERVAVGLPIDVDGDPTTPDRLDPRHPFVLTENGLRTELGEPARIAYGTAERLR